MNNSSSYFKHNSLNYKKLSEELIKELEKINGNIIPKDLYKKIRNLLQRQSRIIENIRRVVYSFKKGDWTFTDLEEALKEQKRQDSLASSIQENIFPKKFPSNNIISITPESFSFGETTGDFFEVIEIIPKSLYGIFLADIQGHGVSAALDRKSVV